MIFGKHLLAALCIGAAPPCVAARDYPAKPIRLVVPNGVGGSTDLVARTVAHRLTENLGQQVLMDNRGGSGGIIGTELVARAARDGYTLLMGTIGNLAISPHLYRNLSYDPIRDFAPVTQVSSAAYILLVSPSLPAKSVKELVGLAKAAPGQLAYASAGSGTGSHLTAELFLAVAAIRLTHVPYKGGAPGITDLISDRVQMMYNGIPASLPHMKAGRVRALAVTTAGRVSVTPDLPTFAEAGYPAAESTSWTGVLAPAGTPRAIVDRLNAGLRAVLQSSDIKDRLVSHGAEPIGNSPEVFGAFIKAELGKWGKVVSATGTRAD